MKGFVFTMFATSCLIFLACGNEPQQAASSGTGETRPLRIVATNYPVYYFAQRLAPEGMEVLYPVPADEDPAYWRPGPDDVALMQEADLVLKNGATYEKWAAYTSVPPEKIVETARAFEEAWLRIEDAIVHSHGPEGEHAHEGIDFNTWLNPKHAVKQAEAARKAIVALDPSKEQTVTANFEGLKADLMAIDAEFTALAQQLGETPLAASHPVYDYFADAYGLNIRSVHWEPDTVPTPEQFTEFRVLYEEEPVAIMLWEGEPAEQTAEMLENLGSVKSVVFETAGNTPENGDFVETMKANAERLRNAL